MGSVEVVDDEFLKIILEVAQYSQLKTHVGDYWQIEQLNVTLGGRFVLASLVLIDRLICLIHIVWWGASCCFIVVLLHYQRWRWALFIFTVVNQFWKPESSSFLIIVVVLIFWCTYGVVFICRYCTYGVVFICRYCTYDVVFICRYCTYGVVFICRYCTYGVAFICRYCTYGVVFICRYCTYE